MAEFEDQKAARFKMRGRLADEVGVKFIAFFSAEESNGGFVVSHFARQRFRFAAGNVGRIAYDEVE